MAERKGSVDRQAKAKAQAVEVPTPADNNGEADAPTTIEPGETSRLMEHWKSTLELRNDQYRTFDKSILAVSGGALGISIANADKLSVGPGGFTELLVFSWLAFGLSIASNIASYWTGTKDAERELDKIAASVEKGREYEIGNAYRTATYGLNFAALLLFCVGVVLLSIHAYQNMESSHARQERKTAFVGTEGDANP